MMRGHRTHAPRGREPWRLAPIAIVAAWSLSAGAAAGFGQTRIRIMPPDGAVFAVGQRFDLRVEATSEMPGEGPPRGLRVALDGKDITSTNVLDAGVGGERGAGGTGTKSADPLRQVGNAPPNTTNFVARDLVFDAPGRHTITARTADGASARVTVTAEAWQTGGPGGRRGVRNIIFFLGDGMGIAHRTAARIVSRGVTNGRARAPLAMDRLPVTGLVTTFSLNSVITDSAPGMAAYVTGHKSSNNQLGVYPDNTPDTFDNPRVEYLGELLRRERGEGFNVGIVTTADVTDATPAANAVHTADRVASLEIARRFVDERRTNAVRVLMGGGREHFLPEGKGGTRKDGRDLVDDLRKDGFVYVTTARELERQVPEDRPPSAILGLFATRNLNVAFDRVGAGRYSREVDRTPDAREQPMLEDMTRAALRSLAAHSPAGFYLVVEGASIDKQSHAVDAERTIWDTIEMDRAVAVALEFAARTNSDADPANDTLVIVTADHECGGLAIVAVGNERYAPEKLKKAVRDYAAVFRFEPEQLLNFEPNYEVDDRGFPKNPDPSRKLLLGWAAAPDRFENWISNRMAGAAAGRIPGRDEKGRPHPAVANPRRDGASPGSDNRTVDGDPIPGFFVSGVIENGELACTPDERCPGDTSSAPITIAGHTGSDVPLSAAGPGALQFTGSYDNTAVFLKLLRALAGTYPDPTLMPADTEARRR